MGEVRLMDYEVEILTRLDQLDTLRSSWDDLAMGDAEVLACFQWFFSAARSFYEDGALHVIVVRRQERLVAIAPLALTLREGVRWLELIGASDLHEPSGLLYRDEEALGILCQAISSSRCPVALERINRGELVKEHLVRSRSRCGHLRSAGTTSSPFVEVASRWETYEQSLSSRRRYDYRRGRRVLERFGTVESMLISPTEKEASELLTTAFRVEKRSWKGLSGSAIETSPRMREFFLDLGVAVAAQGRLRLAFLRVNDEPIAMQIALLHADAYWLLKVGYDESWSKVSPGYQLMMDVVRIVHERGLCRAEFLGTEESWLGIWANDSRSYANLFFLPYSLDSFRSFAAITFRRLMVRISNTRRRIGN